MHLYGGSGVSYRPNSEPALEPPAPPGRGGAHDPQGPHVTAGQFFFQSALTIYSHQMCFPTSKALECSKNAFFSQETR